MEVGSSSSITMVLLPLKSKLQQYLLIFLFPFLILLIFISLHRRRRPKPNLPPGPQPFPIIGNLHNLRGGLPHLSFHRLSQKYGPIIYLKLGQVPSIVISTADLASEILKSQDNIFCNRGQLTTFKTFSYGGKDIAFAPFDDHWKNLRRLCNSELLNIAKVQSFNAIRRDEVNALVNTITKACSRKKEVNLRETLLCCTNNILFRVVFGKRISTHGEFESSPLKSLLGEILGFMIEFGVEDLFPSMGWIDVITGRRPRLRRTFEKMDLMFEEMIRERIMIMKKRHDGDIQEDFLDVLLHLHEIEDDDQYLNMNEIKAILMNMFIGGADSTAATVEWGMTRLMMNPTVMNKAQEEVRRVVGNKGKVNESHLQHLHYLKMVIKESMRIDPPGTLPPPRECMKDTVVGGYDIPEKTWVYVNIWSIGRDPKYWGDDDQAECFSPERFENSLVNFKGAHMELIPFGAGKRMCPGMPLAMAAVELVYATLLYEFDWALPKGMVREDIDLTADLSFVHNKRVPLILVPTPYLSQG